MNVFDKTPKPSVDTPSNKLFIKKVLIPIDFSEPCLKALRYGIAFSEQFEAKLILVHVVRKINATARITLDQPRFQQKLKQEGEKLLDAIVKKEIKNKMNVAKVVKNGVPFDEIVNTAKRYCVDIIIIATHGYSGLKHVVMGSTAERVVRHAPCPVLVVREREQDFISEKQMS